MCLAKASASFPSSAIVSMHPKKLETKHRPNSQCTEIDSNSTFVLYGIERATANHSKARPSIYPSRAYLPSSWVVRLTTCFSTGLSKVQPKKEHGDDKKRDPNWTYQWRDHEQDNKEEPGNVP